MKANLFAKIFLGIVLALIQMGCGSSNDSTSQLTSGNDTRVLNFSPGLEYNAHRDVMDSIIETELIQYTLEQRSTLSDWWDSITGAAGRAELSNDEQNEVSYFLIEKFFNRYNNDFGKYYGIYGDELSTHINSLGHDSDASQSVEAFTSSLSDAYAVSAKKSALSQSVTDDFSVFLTTFLETDGFEEHVISAASMLDGRINNIYLNTITSDPDSTLTRQEALEAFNVQFLQNDSQTLEALAVAEAQSIIIAASQSNTVPLLEWQNEIYNEKFANLANGMADGSQIPEACLARDKIVLSQSLSYDQYGSTSAGQLGDGTLTFFPSAQDGAITWKDFPKSGVPTSSYVPGFATAYLDADTWGEFIWVGDGEIYLYDDQKSGFTQITSADLDISKLPSVGGLFSKHAKIVYTVQGAMFDSTGTVHIVITASYFEDTISDNSGVEPLLIYYTYDQAKGLAHQNTVQTTGFAKSGCNTFLAAQGKTDIYINAITDGVNPAIMMGAGSTCASKSDSSTTFYFGSVSDLQSLDNYTDLSSLSISPDTLPSGTLRQTNQSSEPSCTYYAPIAAYAKDASANFYNNTQFNNNGFNDAYASPSKIQYGYSSPDISAVITSPACDNGENCTLTIEYNYTSSTADANSYKTTHTFSDTFAVTVDGTGGGFKDSMSTFSSTTNKTTSSKSYGMGESKTTYCNSSTCSETALEPLVLYHAIPYAFIEVNGIKSGGTTYSTGDNVVQLVNLGGTPGFFSESISTFDSSGSLQTALFGSFDFKTATADSYLNANFYSTDIGGTNYQCVSPQDQTGSGGNCYVSTSQGTSQTTSSGSSSSISADIITGFKSSFLGFFSMTLQNTISFGTQTTSSNSFTESFGQGFKVTFTYSNTGMDSANSGNVFPYVGYYFKNRTANASYGTSYNDYFTVATSWLESTVN